MNGSKLRYHAYGEPFEIKCGDPGLEGRLRRFLSPDAVFPNAVSSQTDALHIEFVEERFPDSDVDYRDFSYEILDDRFLMNYKKHPVVEIPMNERKARVRYDPRWIETVPSLVESLVIEAPMLVLLSWFSMPYLHGAAVSYRDQGYILIGEQGAGKSTLAYTCCLLGLSFHAEDYVFVNSVDDRLILYGQPVSLKLCEDTVSFFPHIADNPRVNQPDGEVKIDVLSEVSLEKRLMEAELRGIILLSKDLDAGRDEIEQEIEPDVLYSMIIDDIVFDPAGLARRHEKLYRAVSQKLVGVIPMKNDPEKRAELLMEMISR
jgi:hypothetical protein